MAGGKAGIVASELFQALKSRGWHLKDVTILEELLQEMDEEELGRYETENIVEAKLLDMDLRTIGHKCLPDASTIQRLSHLQGPKVLQIVSLRNILESSDRAVVPNPKSHGRLLRICLTDGHSNVTAIEYCPLPSIPAKMAPGTKICIKKTVSMQSGILLLENHSLSILGGRVQSLYEEWEIDCKYSGFFRSTVKSSQVQGSSGPPPFERIEISPVQTLHKSQASASMNKRMAKETTSDSINQNTPTGALMQDVAFVRSGRKLLDPRLSQTKHNVCSLKNGGITTERIRVGYEPYRPKASDHKPVENLKSSAELMDKTSLCSHVETELLSMDQEQNGSPGDMIFAELNTNNTPSELRKNEILGGQPDAVDQKTVLVTEAVPVQNQAAAQKLLKKMSDTGRGFGESKHGRFGKPRARHNGKGKQEAGLLTLDEWEMQNGKTKPVFSTSDDVSQDEELARQLQAQLDLEAATVKVAHEDEAEKIRMSMFNFRNMNDNNHNDSRKQRGRGRGKRRFN